MKNIYLLKSCNEWKEHSSSKVILATSDKQALAVATAGEILLGNMEYKGLCNDAGYFQFADDVKNGLNYEDNLKYGYIEEVDCLSKEDTEELRVRYDTAIDAFEHNEIEVDDEDNEEM